MLILLIMWICSLCYAQTVTDKEIKAGYVVKAPESWGRQSRHQNSMRILCIGGSNTATGYYSGYLHEYLQSNVSNSEYFRLNSYALNRGVSGHSAMSFVGKMYDFEYNSTSTWPNIVVIDTSVNFNYRRIVHKEVPLVLESLVKSIEFKFKLHSLEVPDFLFFNMPHLIEMIAAANVRKSIPERQQFLDNYDNLTEAGSSLSLQIISFAQHYHLPVLSWHEAMLPAAQRYFISSNDSYNVRSWPYIEDAIHMSPLGAQWGVKNLLVPFLREAMKARKEIQPLEVPRLYPPRSTLVEVASYQAFWMDVNPLLMLQNAIVKKGLSTATSPDYWDMVPLRHNEECYGSSVKDSQGELQFQVPTHCSTKLSCRVQVSFIHSWNDSYVGNTSCTLSKLESPRKRGILLGGEPLFINGQAGVESHTFSIKSVFNANVSEGLHSIRCTTLVSNRLSCVHALDVNAVVML